MIGIDDDPDGDRRHLHGTLQPIRRRGRLPYANEPGSPWEMAEAELKRRIIQSMSTGRATIIPASAGTHFHVKWEE